MSTPQTVNDITAAVVQPPDSFAAELPAVIMLPQDDIARFIKEQEERFVKNSSCPPGALFFREYYTCHRAGSYRSTAKKRRVKPSIRCGCKARISVSSFEADKGFVKVTYHWKHVGHTPGSLEDLN
ncbi:uncharacterized protein BYT42DRAFT_618194 [Radiomyces spectabilis]|uniref:uncharacterized protein n=1 Tax=Radiomyces spectabilis TaxID=64574 RepID=UPI00221F92AE|nr:uncharacterized protein BYT42DRAFT_618194 [Radiomyces spectabilis]KAI8366688.1 hypothetical protein BYT42DRAFT_618194 [Radiomyces spectabilis]